MPQRKRALEIGEVRMYLLISFFGCLPDKKESIPSTTRGGSRMKEGRQRVGKDKLDRRKYVNDAKIESRREDARDGGKTELSNTWP